MPRMSSEPSSDHKAGQQAFRQLLDGGRVGHRVEVTHQNHLTSSLRDVSGRPGIILRIRILANDSHDVVGRGLAALVLYLSLYFPCRDASQPHFPPLLRGRGPWKFRKSRVRPKGSSHTKTVAPRFGRGGVAGGPIGHRAGRTTDHADPRRSPPARGLPKARAARCHALEAPGLAPARKPCGMRCPTLESIERSSTWHLKETFQGLERMWPLNSGVFVLESWPPPSARHGLKPLLHPGSRALCCHTPESP